MTKTKTTKLNRTGEVAKNNQGLTMEIIAYHRYADIDVQFEDGYVVKHRTYGDFKKGCIKNIHFPSAQDAKRFRLGEIKQNNQGLSMKIIAYRNVLDIDVQFEDGYVVEHRTYGNFKKGVVKHPKYKRKHKHQKMAHLGETNLNSQGLLMKIIAYRDYRDIDVQFEDGYISKNRNYEDFKDGTIRNKNFDNPSLIMRRKSIIGTKKTNKFGETMTVIEYADCNHCSIEYDNGDILKDVNIRTFYDGISSPSRIKKLKVGEKSMASNGMEMEIIAYRRSDDIDVRFEDGYERTTGHCQFISGHVLHNCLGRGYSRTKTFAGFKYKRLGNVEDKVLYECECEVCGYKDILTPQQMMEHEKTHVEA